MWRLAFKLGLALPAAAYHQFSRSESGGVAGAAGHRQARMGGASLPLGVSPMDRICNMQLEIGRLGT